MEIVKVIDEEVSLVRDRDGLALVGPDFRMHGDFTRMLPRLKQNNLRGEFLVKAAHIKNLDHEPIAVDATAGLGEDSLLLAAAGYRVYLFEHDEVIADLLEDSILRAKEHPVLAEIVERMTVIRGDSTVGLTKLSFLPDVVVLDPMFPERSKSASVKKKFQLLHHLEAPCSSEEELLLAAVAASPRKIVIKRPVKGPFLAGRKPDYSYAGKAIRYDCILVRA